MNKKDLTKIYYALQLVLGKEGIELFKKILELIN